MTMKTRRATARALIALLAAAGLVGSGCSGGAGVDPTHDGATETPIDTTSQTETPIDTTSQTETPIDTTSQTETPVDTTSQTETPINGDPETEYPRTVPLEHDPLGQPPDYDEALWDTPVVVGSEPRIAFYSNMDRDTEIVVWDINATDERLLTDNFDEELHPTWSPDGTRVALVSDRAGNYDIFVVDADGSNPVQVTDDEFRESNPVWSPDGTRIAYVRFSHDSGYRDPWYKYNYVYGESYDDRDFDIFVTDADGSNTVRITHDDYREMSPLWSPDGTRIAYTRDILPGERDDEYEIMIVGADGSDPFKLTDDGIGPVWSPDGTRIAYDHIHRRIYVAEADGSSTRQLVRGQGPSWSPDGTRIIYSSDRPATSTNRAGSGTGSISLYAGKGLLRYDEPPVPTVEIHVIGADGTNPVQLTRVGRDKFQPQWSPDGTRILYTNRSNGNYIFVMDADGQHSLQITDNGRNPVWSPDGTRIAYTLIVDRHERRPYLHSRYEVFAMSPEASGLTKLADDGEEPSWSPDGTHLVYSNDDEVFLARSDGTGTRQLTDTFGDDRSWAPVLSPDGTRIAFLRGPWSGGPIFVMDADGSNIKQIIEYMDRRDRPAWSPDSARIAYATFGDSADIEVVNADGTDPVNLTADHATLGAGRAVCPAWSPDGSQLAFAGRPGDRSEAFRMWVMDADGADMTQITDHPDVSGCPVWSPDGTRFLYAVYRDVGELLDVPEIWVVGVDGNDPRRLTERGTSPAWSPDSSRIAFVSDRDGDWEIFVMDADGSNQTQLTFNNDDDLGPVWFPLADE